MKNYETYVNTFHNARSALKVAEKWRRKLEEEILSTAKFEIGDKVRIEMSEKEERRAFRRENGVVGIVSGLRVMVRSCVGHGFDPKPTSEEDLVVMYKLNKVKKDGTMHKTASACWGVIREDSLVKVVDNV